MRRILLLTLVLVAACRTAADMSGSEPREVVATALRKLWQPRNFPPPESRIAALFPPSERSRIASIPQQGGHDLSWHSADESCFVTFMVDGDRASSIWGKCTVASAADGGALLRAWLRCLPPLDTAELPTPERNFVHTWIRGDDTAVDLSIQKDGETWLAGFGLRSGVPR